MKSILPFVMTASMGVTFGVLLAEAEVDRPAAEVKATPVDGTVTYTGPLPRSVPVAEAGTERHLIEVHAKTRGLKDAMVYLEGAKSPARGEKKKAAVMDQQNYFFVPHVLGIEEGQEVQFLNSDGANHGVVASSAELKNTFNVITPPAGSFTHRFVVSRHPVKIGCPLHAGMGGWVFIFGHPYFAVTDKEGKFQLPPVSPGQYKLVVRHPDGGMQKRSDLAVQEGKPVALKVEFGKADLKP